MDPATILGILIAFAGLFAMIVLEGANIGSIFLPAPMILVFGATIAVAIASGTLADSRAALTALPRAFRGRLPSSDTVIDELVGIAEVARRDGLLALERRAAETDDPFLATAMQNIADGADAEDLRTLLDDQIDGYERQARIGARFYTTMGGYAPTIGIIGTVVSLTHVLEQLEDPSSLGHAIAAAFVATLWGVLSANFLWLPIGARLSRLVELDVDRMNLIAEGTLAIQSGAQPRVLDERLRAMVPGGSAKKPAGADDFVEAA